MRGALTSVISLTFSTFYSRSSSSAVKVLPSLRAAPFLSAHSTMCYSRDSVQVLVTDANYTAAVILTLLPPAGIDLDTSYLDALMEVLSR